MGEIDLRLIKFDDVHNWKYSVNNLLRSIIQVYAPYTGMYR